MLLEVLETSDTILHVHPTIYTLAPSPILTSSKLSNTAGSSFFHSREVVPGFSSLVKKNCNFILKIKDSFFSFASLLNAIGLPKAGAFFLYIFQNASCQLSRTTAAPIKREAINYYLFVPLNSSPQLAQARCTPQ